MKAAQQMEGCIAAISRRAPAKSDRKEKARALRGRWDGGLPSSHHLAKREGILGVTRWSASEAWTKLPEIRIALRNND